MPTQVYRKKNGAVVKGATTILGALAKPGLIFWGYDQGLANYNKITEQIIDAIHLPGCSLNEIEGIIKNFQVGRLYEKRDAAASSGTLAHAMVEADLKGWPPPDTSKANPAIRAKAEGCYIAFLEWKDRTKFKLIHSEIPLVSEVFSFGGCLDIGGGVSDLELIDLKTSKAIFWSNWLQLAGYCILWDETHSEKMKGFNILRIGPDGDFGHERRSELSVEKEMFLDLVRFYHKMESKGWKL